MRLMSTLLVHLCSGLLLAPRVAVRFDAVDPSILSLLRAGGLYTTLDDFSAAAEGLAVWRSALAAGRVPDFEGVDAAAGAPWPVQPLRGALGDAMLELEAWLRGALRSFVSEEEPTCIVHGDFRLAAG